MARGRQWVRTRGGRSTRILVSSAACLAILLVFAGAQTLAAPAGAPTATGWTFFKYPTPQPACAGVALGDVRYWNKRDCGSGEVLVSGTQAGDSVKVRLLGPGGASLGPDLTTVRQTDDGAWRFTLTPAAAWESGTITARVVEVKSGAGAPQTGNFGETTFYLNQLGAAIAAPTGSFKPGDPLPVVGRLFELWHKPSALIEPPTETDVAGQFFLRVVTPAGEVRGPYG